MKLLSSILFILITTILSSAQYSTLVWSDEFTNIPIDLNKWQFEIGGGGFGNNELQNYTARSENATIKNGMLHIIAKKEVYQNNQYTSARLVTKGLHSWKYGKIEAKIKIPSGKGIWPAFWMLGENISTVSWPACGEIDIMEHVNNELNIYGTIHWLNNVHVEYGKKVDFDATLFHTYAIQWNNQSIQWFLDGVKYHEANILNNINSTEEFHKPFFILLNLAVGGQWPGNPDATTRFPDTLSIDYVRVYQDIVTGVNSEMNAESIITMQPNPTNGNSIVNYTLELNQYTNLTITDVFGRNIMSVFNEYQNSGVHQIPINLTHLPKGVYILGGTINGKPIQQRFVKE